MQLDMWRKEHNSLAVKRHSFLDEMQCDSLTKLLHGILALLALQK